MDNEHILHLQWFSFVQLIFNRGMLVFFYYHCSKSFFFSFQVLALIESA